MKNSPLESKKRLDHILKAIENIETFVQTESMETFCQNDILNNAVLYNFTIMGEAIIHVETDMLDKYEYPWYKVRAFRNMISHVYFNIKMDAVWLIIFNDIPELKKLVEQMLKNEF